MASITAIVATDASSTASCVTCVVRLHDIGIGDTQICGKAGEIQASRFFTNTTLEVANREVVDEGHLRLHPVPKDLIGKASGVEDDEFVGINDLTDLCQALH